MNKHKLPVTFALSFSVVVVATSSYAKPPASSSNINSSTTTTAPTGPLPPNMPPAQAAPIQPVTVAPPTPVQSTTTITAAPYYPPASDTYESKTERRPNRPLIATGTGLFIGSYVPSVVAAATSERDEDKKLFIPVVGPWLALDERDCVARGCGGNDDVAKAMMVTSGVAQGVGVLLVLSSLIFPETAHTTHVAAAKPTIRVTPTTYTAGGGLGAFGTF